MNKDDEKLVYGFCDRLRKLRKHLNMNIEELASNTGLTFSQIQRLEADTRVKNGDLLKRGAEGRAATMIILLNYYGKHISLDLLFNFNVPVTDLIPDKMIEKDILKEKIQSIIPFIKDVVKYLD
jgi:transcriptional regulator with XRE-family HTH domain